MKKHIKIPLCLLFLYLAPLCISEFVDTFEFGVNKGRITFSKKGIIGRDTLITEIPIDIPKCRKLSYVRVDVNNKENPPFVKFDFEKNIITIKYRRLQYSYSSYNIISKSTHVYDCFEWNIAE